MLLLTRELEIQHPHIVVDNILDRLCAAIVEVRSMLPQTAKGGRTVPLLCRACCVRRIHPGFGWGMESSVVIVSEGAVHVATGTIGVEDDLTPLRCFLAVGA